LVREVAEKGAIPGGTKRNLQAAADYTSWSDGISELDRSILCDAQTSGGLLIAVDPGVTDELVNALRQNKTPVATVVGEVVESDTNSIEVVT